MKIGFIGLGIMGEAMCRNIVHKHSDTVYCYDIDKEKQALLLSEGACFAADNQDLATKADIIITMVPKASHVRAVAEEILPCLTAEKIWIDMSTIEPSVSREIAARVRQTGAAFLDAPVVKSRPAAEAGTLGIYVGGLPEDFTKVEPIFRYMGAEVLYLGENGSGLVMKICHNALVGQIQNGVNETAALAAKAGIDIETYAKAISMGGGQNFYLDGKAAVIAKGEYPAAFSVANMDKDVHIALSLAKEYNLPMPGEENVVRVYEKAMEQGLGGQDFSATYKIVSAGENQ